jgi:secretion/DNA translocation related TadE-like protein
VIGAERGSVTLIVAAALAFAGILAAFGADVTRAIAGRGRAQAAADAAALAAAQELVVPSDRSLQEVAAEYAERGGARLESCSCDPASDEVVVTVALDVELPLLGQVRTVRARARAVVEATAGTQGLQAWFVARLACLVGRVPGIRVVSGFRTRSEQARLHEQRPDLAAPPGRSMHERGLAADLAFPSGSAQAAAHSLADACGLHFPVQGEPWHVEPISRGPSPGGTSDPRLPLDPDALRPEASR